MIIHICATGETVHSFKPDGNIIIGVNDSAKFVHPDYLVCVDTPQAFPKEKYDFILNTKCKKFFSFIEGWKKHIAFEQISLDPHRGMVSNLIKLKHTNIFNHSCTSPFVAAVLAYKLGATSIIMWGVDMNTHPKVNGFVKDQAMRDFRNLFEELKKDNVSLYVGDKRSSLSEFIPVWEQPL